MSSSPPKILSIVGARPQFVKSGVVSRALKRTGLAETLVHTGQHFDKEMSSLFFEELGLREPAFNLGIAGGTHSSMTASMLSALGVVLEEQLPDLVLVYGDTNSTLAGALAAAKLRIPVAHVEAGLRSFNQAMPEEINRVLTDHMSSLLLCPTSQSVANLALEGITKGVHHVGDVMFDVVVSLREKLASQVPACEQLGLEPGSYALATVHRAENTESPDQLEKVLDYLRGVDSPVLLPLHPRTKVACERWGIPLDGLIVVAPVGYLTMASFIAESSVVITDSGGLQKEAYFHGVPCVTMRGETEWVETIEAGWNRLWTSEYLTTRRTIDEYGKGHASEAVAEAISVFLG